MTGSRVRHPEKVHEVREIWRVGNDFTMRDIARAVGLTERQVQYAVRQLPKTDLQQRRHERARRT